MAFVYFYGTTGKFDEHVWINTQTNNLSAEEPSVPEMLYDMIISHSKIERDIGEVTLLIRDEDNQSKHPGSNAIDEKRLKKYIANATFSKTLAELVNNCEIKNIELLRALKELNCIRGNTVHSNMINSLFRGEKIIRIVDDFEKGIQLNLGEQNQVLLENSDEMKNNFKKYTEICQAHCKFFFSSPEEKIRILKGEL